MLKLPKMAAVFILPFLVMGCFLVLPTEGAALVQMNGLLMEEGAGRFSQKFKDAKNVNIIKEQRGVLEVEEDSGRQKQRKESVFPVESIQKRPLENTIIPRRIARGVIRRCLAGRPFCFLTKRRKPKKKTAGRGTGESSKTPEATNGR